MKTSNISLSKLFSYGCFLIFLMLTTNYSYADSIKNIRSQEHPITINNVNNPSPTTDQEKISDQERNGLIFQIAESSKNEVVSWGKNQLLWFTLAGGLGLLFGALLGGWALIKVSVANSIEKHLDRLDGARMEAVKATSIAVSEVEATKAALIELQKLEIAHKGLIAVRTEELDKLQKESIAQTEELDKLKKESEEFKSLMKATYEEVRLGQNNDLDFIFSVQDVYKDWLIAIDSNYQAANTVIDNLIQDFNSSFDVDERLVVLGKLSHFEGNDDRILRALEQALKKDDEEPAIIFEVLNLIGNSKDFHAAFGILKHQACELFNPKTAATLGALGVLQERNQNDAATKLIAAKLIDHLEKYIRTETQNDNQNKEKANVINAAVTALIHSNTHVEPAIPLLLELIEDSTSYEYKTSAAIVLGNMREKAIHAIPALEKLAENEITVISSAATDALSKIRKG